MSRRPIEVGNRVEITAPDEHAGRRGIVREVFNPDFPDDRAIS